MDKKIQEEFDKNIRKLSEPETKEEVMTNKIMKVLKVKCQHCGEYLLRGYDKVGGSIWLTCPNMDKDTDHHTIMIYDKAKKELL